MTEQVASQAMSVHVQRPRLQTLKCANRFFSSSIGQSLVRLTFNSAVCPLDVALITHCTATIVASIGCLPMVAADLYGRARCVLLFAEEARTHDVGYALVVVQERTLHEPNNFSMNTINIKLQQKWLANKYCTTLANFHY